MGVGGYGGMGVDGYGCRLVLVFVCRSTVCAFLCHTYVCICVRSYIQCMQLAVLDIFVALYVCTYVCIQQYLF